MKPVISISYQVDHKGERKKLFVGDGLENSEQGEKLAFLGPRKHCGQAKLPSTGGQRACYWRSHVWKRLYAALARMKIVETRRNLQIICENKRHNQIYI